MPTVLLNFDVSVTMNRRQLTAVLRLSGSEISSLCELVNLELVVVGEVVFMATRRRALACRQVTEDMITPSFPACASILNRCCLCLLFMSLPQILSYCAPPPSPPLESPPPSLCLSTKNLWPPARLLRSGSLFFARVVSVK